MSDATEITIPADAPLFLLVNLVEHSLRRKVIQYILDLDNKTDRFAPVEIARTTGLSNSNTIYHFNLLKRGGVVKLVDTEPRAGATKHIYERDYVLNEHEALIKRLMKEATNEKRWLSRQPSLRTD
jgi:hypothetical protein